MAQVVKIDSNITGLRYCQEVSLGALDETPANQTWIALEPNSYSNFGGQVSTVSRNPINPGRQRFKGTAVNVEAAAAFDSDITMTNFRDLLQGFFYAQHRRKANFTGSVTVDGTTDEAFGATSIEDDFVAGDLIFVTNCDETVNNGLHLIDATGTDSIEVTSDLVDEGPTAGVQVECVGFQFGSGEAGIVNSGSAFPYLNRESGSKDFTDLGLIPGEPVYLGGDTTATQFAQAANNGFARVRSVVADRITFDKTEATMVTDTGSGKTIRLFKGTHLLKNEIGSSIVRSSYTLERTLGASNDADITLEQAQYVRGGVPNELEITAAAADKLVGSLSFTGTAPDRIDENVSGANSLLSKVSGVVREDAAGEDAVNTSSDISRIRLAEISTTNAFPSPLFTYSEELSLTINNNNSPENALGVYGAFEITAGTFEVGGEITAFFGNVAAIAAVENNSDVTIDISFVKANRGIVIDIPLIGLGDGGVDVSQDEAVRIPLETNAFSAAKIDPNLNHTLLMSFFTYLPTAAG